MGGDTNALCINRAGFRKTEGSTIFYYILPESFKEICKGYPEMKAAQVLRDAGLLKTNRTDVRGLKSQLPTVPGIGRPMVYKLCLTDNEANESK